MPTVTITKNWDDGQPLTESMLDDIKTSVETALNTTKLDSDNIQDGGIDEDAIAALAVSTGKIANLAVETGKIAAGAVTPAKLASAVRITEPGQIHNLSFKAAQTSVANDSIEINSADGTDLSASNPGYVCLPSTTAGQVTVFEITAKVKIRLDGAHWGLDTQGDQTDVPLHVLAINNSGSLAWGISLFNRQSIVDTATSTTRTDINLTSEVLVNTALTAGTWPCISLVSLDCDFDDTGGSSENLWAVGTAVSDYVFRPAMGAPTKWLAFVPVVNFDSQTTSGRWRRNGQNLELDCKLNMTGAVSNNSLQWTLPFSLAMPSFPFAATGNLGGVRGSTVINDGGANWYSGSGLSYVSSTVLGSTVLNAASTIALVSNVTQASPITYANGDEIYMWVSVPISGWEK